MKNGMPIWLHADGGWSKRGIFFSRFERACPEQLRYRIELTAPDWFDEPGMPAEQVTLYEDCGWHLAAQRGIVNIFCAPVDSDVPELYTDPRQQAAALRTNFTGGIWWNVIFRLLSSWRLIFCPCGDDGRQPAGCMGLAGPGVAPAVC